MSNRPNYTGYRIDAYRLVSLLGRGSVGDVYLVEHVDRHTQFAIKLFFGFTGAEVRNFINEVSILARLKHPNIVPLVHFGTGRLIGPASSIENIPFLVMYYATGGTLKDRFPVKQQPTYYQVPLHTVVDYIGQVAAALQCAHDDPIGAIIHRDVKPANMLVANDGRIMLSDFGIGIPERIFADSLYIETKGYLGTPLYTAPEQWIGKPVTASDQYSLAVVTYQWLAGRCPFEGNFWQLARQHSSSSPPPLRESNPSLPASAEAVILRALEKEPGKRFATVKEFALALARSSGLAMPAILESSAQEPGETEPLPAPQPPNFSRRAIIAVGLATGLILAGGGSTLLVNRLERVQSAKTSAKTPTPALKQSPTPAPGTHLYTYSKHRDSVDAVSWSPSGKYVASASEDGTVRIWNATTGVDLFPPFEGHGPVRTVAWSPDGQYIAFSGDDPTVQVWDLANRAYHAPYKRHTNLVKAVVWSPDGRFIASAGYDGTVHVWDITTLADLFPAYQGHSPFAVYAVAWSPDGQRIASTGNDKTVQVWDATTGRNLLDHQTSGHGFAITWSPDSQYIAFGGDDKLVHVWNATTGVELLFPAYQGHSPFAVYAVAWSPDGPRIASGGADMRVKVWNAATGTDLFTCAGHKQEVLAAAWSPGDGSRIASASRDGTAQVWTTV